MFAKADSPLPLGSQYLESLSEEDVTAIIANMNMERLSAYRHATRSNVEALALYELNARLSNCLHEVIGGLEVVLRNAVSEAVKDHFKRKDWYGARTFTSLLTPERRRNLREVRKRLTARRQTVESGRVVAGLTLYFWVAMHEKKYRDTLWTPFLRTIWPYNTDIRDVHKDLLKICKLRNRIAHYEPIFADCWRHRSDIIWLRLEQLSPSHHAWFEDRIRPTLDALNGDLDRLGD